MQKDCNEDRRIVMIQRSDNVWQAIEFKDIKKGDIVKLFEPDNNELVSGHEIEALSDAYDFEGILRFDANI